MAQHRMKPTPVRRHFRRLKSGRHVAVRRHVRVDRVGAGMTKALNRPHRTPRPYRWVLDRRRGWNRLRRSRHMFRRKRGTAGLVLGLAGVVELLMWFVMRGTGLVVGALVLVLGTVAAFGVSRTMFDTPKYGGTHRSRGRFEE